MSSVITVRACCSALAKCVNGGEYPHLRVLVLLWVGGPGFRLWTRLDTRAILAQGDPAFTLRPILDGLGARAGWSRGQASAL